MKSVDAEISGLGFIHPVPRVTLTVDLCGYVPKNARFVAVGENRGMMPGYDGPPFVAVEVFANGRTYELSTCSDLKNRLRRVT